VARTRTDRDFYGVLGLRPEATEDEIRRAYRRLALEWHPDRRPGDRRAEERFKEISEAYAVLIDPAKRETYDRARQGTAPGGFQATREDVFRDLFNDPRASAVFEELAREFERMGVRVNRHAFEQTLFGGRTVVRGAVVVVSPLTPLLTLLRVARGALAGGRGPGPTPAETATLPAPGGLFGRVLDAGRRLLGLPATGTGGVGADDLVFPLRVSRREAREGGRRRLTLARGDGATEVIVTIPRGVRPGTRLRLRGKGRPRAGGLAGDAYLVVEVSD
jgi:DnaJ-class molecular chaperone